MKNKRLGRVGGALALSQVILVILSWLLSAAKVEGVRSLLSSEGIRWFFGSFPAMVASPLLAWLILALAALGCFQKSGFWLLISRRFSAMSYRDRIALRVSCSLLIIYIGVIALLTLMPHAILLSVTGALFPSAFSHSLVPILAFGICLFSVAFGMMSGRIRSLAAVLDSLSFGIEKGAGLLILYILLIQFCESLWFVFG